MEEDEVNMVDCKTLDEFVRRNDSDVRRIIISKFKNVLNSRFDISFEDILQSFYLHIAHSRAVEKYDPEFGVKFSTYMFRCIHNYMCAYHIHRRNKDINFYGTLSLDEIKEDSHSRYETIAAKEDESTYDINAIYNEIVRWENKFSYPSRVKLSELFSLYADGYRDADIGRKFKLTSAGVGARKRSLQKLIGPLIDRDESTFL